MWLYRLKFSSVLIHLVNTFSYKLRNSVEIKGKVMAAHTSAYSLWATETVKESKRACDREVDRVMEKRTLSRSKIWFILTEGALSFNSCYNSFHTLSFVLKWNKEYSCVRNSWWQLQRFELVVFDYTVYPNSEVNQIK